MQSLVSNVFSVYDISDDNFAHEVADERQTFRHRRLKRNGTHRRYGRHSWDPNDCGQQPVMASIRIALAARWLDNPMLAPKVASLRSTKGHNIGQFCLSKDTPFNNIRLWRCPTFRSEPNPCSFSGRHQRKGVGCRMRDGSITAWRSPRPMSCRSGQQDCSGGSGSKCSGKDLTNTTQHVYRAYRRR